MKSNKGMIKPTQREIRVVLNALGLDDTPVMYNDKRKNWRRIKICSRQYSHEDMGQIQDLLCKMFPSLKTLVYIHHGQSHYGYVTACDTCIKFT